MSDEDVTLYRDDCEDCLAALEYLEARGLTVAVQDILADPPSAVELLELSEAAGSIEDLVRPDLRDEVTEFDDEGVADYLATDPSRLAHPIVDAGDDVLVGYGPELREAFSSG